MSDWGDGGGGGARRKRAKASSDAPNRPRVSDIPTPAFLVHLPTARRNCRAMLERAKVYIRRCIARCCCCWGATAFGRPVPQNKTLHPTHPPTHPAHQALGVKFRPHVKTHKTRELTRLQLGYGLQDNDDDGAEHVDSGKPNAPSPYRDTCTGIVVSTLAEARDLLGCPGVRSVLYGVPLCPSRIKGVLCLQGFVYYTTAVQVRLDMECSVGWVACCGGVCGLSVQIPRLNLYITPTHPHTPTHRC